MDTEPLTRQDAERIHSDMQRIHADMQEARTFRKAITSPTIILQALMIGAAMAAGWATLGHRVDSLETGLDRERRERDAAITEERREREIADARLEARVSTSFTELRTEIRGLRNDLMDAINSYRSQTK